MVKKHLKYLVEDVSRHDQVRLYYREPGKPKIRIWVSVEHPDFMTAWSAAQRGEQLPKPAKDAPAAMVDGRPAKDSFAALCVDYQNSSPFKALRPISQRNRKLILAHCCAEETKPGSGISIGSIPAVKFGTAHVKLLRDRKADLPEAANNRVKAVRAVYAWAQEGVEGARNPCTGIKKMKSRNTGGFHSWTLAELAQYEARHPVGTMARLALDVALYTSARRSDVVRLGPKHVSSRSGITWISFAQQKTGTEVEIVMIEPFALSIAATPSSSETFLETAFGKPFTANGIGNAFRAWCDEAGLPHCTMHGVRKATGARYAELGCSDKQIAAILGHAPGSKETGIYTRAARRRLLAAEAMDRLMTSITLQKAKGESPTKIEMDKKSGTFQEEKTV